MFSKITPEKVGNPNSADVSWIEKNIPFLGGRPRRDTVISNDDILNLVIASNTCTTLEEFLKVT